MTIWEIRVNREKNKRNIGRRHDPKERGCCKKAVGLKWENRNEIKEGDVKRFRSART